MLSYRPLFLNWIVFQIENVFEMAWELRSVDYEFIFVGLCSTLYCKPSLIIVSIYCI